MDRLRKKKTFIMDNSAIRVDKWLASKLPEYSRTQIVSWIKRGQVTDDHQKLLKAKDILAEGSKITLYLEETDLSDTTPKPQDIPLDIVFEDHDMIIVNKPINLPVHPGAGNKDHTLVNALLYYTKGNLSDLAGEERMGIIHRLDKNTPGLILIAKNNKFHEAMKILFQQRNIRRIYRALVWNKAETPTGTIDAPIGRNPFNRTEMAVLRSGKNAVTYFEVLEEFENLQNQVVASELELELYSGRTHQIRVHLSYINLPIIGDPVYNKRKDNFDLSVQALYAAELAFEHPFTGDYLKFKIDPPQYYKATKQHLLELSEVDH